MAQITDTVKVQPSNYNFLNHLQATKTRGADLRSTRLTATSSAEPEKENKVEKRQNNWKKKQKRISMSSSAVLSHTTKRAINRAKRSLDMRKKFALLWEWPALAPLCVRIWTSGDDVYSGLSKAKRICHKLCLEDCYFLRRWTRKSTWDGELGLNRCFSR